MVGLIFPVLGSIFGVIVVLAFPLRVLPARRHLPARTRRILPVRAVPHPEWKALSRAVKREWVVVFALAWIEVIELVGVGSASVVAGKPLVFWLPVAFALSAVGWWRFRSVLRRERVEAGRGARPGAKDLGGRVAQLWPRPRP